MRYWPCVEINHVKKGVGKGIWDMPLVNNIWKEASGQRRHKDCYFPWPGISFAAYLRRIKLSQDLFIVKGRMVEIHTHKNQKQESLIDFSGNIWQYSMHEEKLLYSDFLTALLSGSWISCQRVWSQKQRLCTESLKEWVYHSQHLLITCWISYWPSHYSEGKLALRENSLDTVYSSQTDDKYT